jgi:hypothetical protein
MGTIPQGSNLIISTRDELFAVGLMQLIRPRQFAAALAGAESNLEGGRGSAMRAAHAVFASKGTSPQHCTAPRKLCHLVLAVSKLLVRLRPRLDDSHLLAYFFSIAAMKPSARNPSIRLISM